MSALSIQPTYPIFTDIDGQPLESGYVWVGVANLDPEVNPINVYWDAGLTIQAAQPVRTLAGYPARNGTPARLYVNSDYSIRVMNRNGSPVYSAPAATERISEVVISGGIDSSGVNFLQAGTGAVVRTVQNKLRDIISVKDFGAVGDGITDDTQAIQDAIDAAAGRYVYVPAGTYRVSDTLSYNASASFGFTSPGIKIIGDGMVNTFFDHRAANKPLIDIDSGTHGGSYTASMGAVLSEFAIINPAATSGAVGVRILNAYEVKIDHLYIKQMTSHGIEMRNGLYVDDGWNMISIKQCWIDSCKGWGIKADGSAARNEGSYTYLEEVFFQTNGTASADAIPPSGGMIWKGQIMVMESCAFANGNENVGLFIKGESGLGQTVDLRNTTFENTKKRGLYATGISVFKGRNLQFYNNNNYVATQMCEFDGASFVIRQVDIDGVTVRATSGNNAITAFKISGANAELDSCRVTNVNWENFDYAGQTRFSGWRFDQIQNCASLVVASASEVYLYPNRQLPVGGSVPLRLMGPKNQTGVGVPSSSGEWIEHELSISGLYYNPATLPLLANTRYYVYLYDNNGLPTLTASTTGWIQSGNGYPVKSDNNSYLYVGSIQGGATNGTVKTTAGGWLNPSVIPGSQVGVSRYVWFDGSSILRSNAALPTSDTDGTAV